jgi:hypothetical protein
MPNIAITPATVTAFNTAASAAAAAAVSSTANEAEVFEVAIVGKPTKVALMFNNANSHGSYTYSIAAGAFGTSGAAVTGTIVQNKTGEVVQLETGKVQDSTGKIVITVTPATGKRLATDHACTIRAINLV